MNTKPPSRPHPYKVTKKRKGKVVDKDIYYDPLGPHFSSQADSTLLPPRRRRSPPVRQSSPASLPSVSALTAPRHQQASSKGLVIASQYGYSSWPLERRPSITSQQPDARESSRKHRRTSPRLRSPKLTKRHRALENSDRAAAPRSAHYKSPTIQRRARTSQRTDVQSTRNHTHHHFDLTSPSLRHRAKPIVSPESGLFFDDINKFLAPEFKVEMPDDPYLVDRSVPEAGQLNWKAALKREASTGNLQNARPSKSSRWADRGTTEEEPIELISDNEEEDDYRIVDSPPAKQLSTAGHTANGLVPSANARGFVYQPMEGSQFSSHRQTAVLRKHSQQQKVPALDVHPYRDIRAIKNGKEYGLGLAKVVAQHGSHTGWSSEDEPVDRFRNANAALQAMNAPHDRFHEDEEMIDSPPSNGSSEVGSTDEETDSDDASSPSIIDGHEEDQREATGLIQNTPQELYNGHSLARKDSLAVGNAGSDAGTTIEDAFQRQRMKQSHPTVIASISNNSNGFKAELRNGRKAEPVGNTRNSMAAQPQPGAASRSSTDTDPSQTAKAAARTKERERWAPGKIEEILNEAKKLRATNELLKQQQEAKRLAERAAKEAEAEAKRADRLRQQEARKQETLLKGSGKGRKEGLREDLDDEVDFSDESDDPLRKERKDVTIPTKPTKQSSAVAPKEAANQKKLGDLRKQQEAIQAAIDAEEERNERIRAKEAKKVERAKTAEQREAERKRAREEKIKREEEERLRREREYKEFVDDLVKQKEAERVAKEQQKHAAEDAELERINWQQGGYKAHEAQREAQLHSQASQRLTDVQAWRKEAADATQDRGERAVATKQDQDVELAWMDMEDAMRDAAMQNHVDAVELPDMKPAFERNTAEQSPHSGLFVPDPNAPAPLNPFRALSSLGAPSVISRLGSEQSKCECGPTRTCVKHKDAGQCASTAGRPCAKHKDNEKTKDEGQCACRAGRPCAKHREEGKCPCRSDYVCKPHRLEAEAAAARLQGEDGADLGASKPLEEPSKSAENDMDLNPVVAHSDPGRNSHVERSDEPAMVPIQPENQPGTAKVDLSVVRNVRPTLKEEDQLLFDLRQGGLEWEEVCGAWRLKIGKYPTDEALKKRYQNARKTLGLQPEGRPANGNKRSGLRKMLLKGMRSTADYGLQRAVSTFSSDGVTPANPGTRPTHGGKTYNQATINAYLASMEEDNAVHDQQDEANQSEVEVDAVRRYVREPSPITADDGLFWGYQVWRKTWPADAEEVIEEDDHDVRFPWALCGRGETFSVLAEANHAASEELRQERLGLDIWGYESFNLSTNHHDGMVFYLATSPVAKAMIKVSRILQTPNMGTLPKSKVGWLGRKAYVIWKRTTVKMVSVVDVEQDLGIDDAMDSGDGQVLRHGVERLDMSTKGLDGNHDVQQMEEQNDLDDLFNDPMELTTAENAQPVSDEPVYELPAETTNTEPEVPAEAPQKQVENIRTETTMIGGVYTILDMANRDAARVYVDITAPKSTRIDGCARRKEAEEATEAEVQRLEERGEGFEAEVEFEDEATEVLVWVETRDLVGTRNI